MIYAQLVNGKVVKLGFVSEKEKIYKWNDPNIVCLWIRWRKPYITRSC